MSSPRDGHFQIPAATLRLSPTAALYVGPPLGVGMHRSAVTCVGEAIDGTLDASLPSGARTGPCRSILVRAGAEHRIEATGQMARFLYVGPRDAFASQAAALMNATESKQLRSSDEPILERLASGAVSGARIDRRIASTLRALDDGASLTLDALDHAWRVDLSESRFLHLFRESTGVAFRRYRLWARLRSAVVAIGHGAPLTRAALDAGFATPSHFSSAFRAMFGVSPSLLHRMNIEQHPSTQSVLRASVSAEAKTEP